MHSRGIYSWKDGRKYEGEYQYDKKQGFGIYLWIDGRRYEGYWANGKQHGKGKYIQVDNSFKLGVWDDGKRIKWVEEPEEIKPSGWDNYEFKGKKEMMAEMQSFIDKIG